MAAGALDTYLKTVHEQFGFHATWLPGTLVKLGDIGVLRDGAFVRTSSLAAKGFHVTIERRAAPAMRYASQGSVDFTASAKGRTDAAVGAIAKAQAGLKVSFSSARALVFVMDSASDESIADIESLESWMRTQLDRKLTRDEIVITHLRRAKAGLIAMASSAGAEVQLKADAVLGQGPLDLADVGGKLALVSSKATEFVSVPSGRIGATPLYRFLHYGGFAFIHKVVFGENLRANLSMIAPDAPNLFPPAPEPTPQPFVVESD
jgi:hypothetical protein